jgi:hypothetical protein
MPMMGIKYKSILKVALLRIFGIAGCSCSLAKPLPRGLRMKSELASLLSVRGLPDSVDAAMRPRKRR